MKFSEILRLVWLNLIQNKFKVILTSTGIIVGAATIVMVIAIGRGGREKVAEQFKNLNAGAIDISYEQADASSQSSGDGNGRSSGSVSGNPGNTNGGGNSQAGFPGGFVPGGASGNDLSGKSGSKKNSDNSGSSGNTGNKGNSSKSGSKSGSTSKNKGNSSSSSSQSGSGEMPGMMNGQGMPAMPGGGMPGMSGSSSGGPESRMNQEKITLSEDDLDDIKTFVPGIKSSTISYTVKSDVEGGDLDEAESYTIGGVKPNYASISNLTLKAGSFITSSDEKSKEKVCILGYTAAKEIFGSVEEAYDSTVYIDGRAYIVNGVLSEVGTVSSGISPDDSIFIPYSTGVKYLTGKDTDPTITVIAEDTDNIKTIKKNIQSVLSESYSNAEFTITDAGSKMKAANESNRTLTLLLLAMAVIVFIVGGIGIMNVLFVSVKERTGEIGILKAIGCPKKDILLEFLLEACFISVIGAVLGILLSFIVTPAARSLGVSVELSVSGAVTALVFAVTAGTLFGFYPAFKASRLVPVKALGNE